MIQNSFLTILLIFPATIFGMQNPGMQELAKHKADFQAGMKKLLEQAPEDLPAEYYSPIRYEHEMRKNREMRRIAKEMENAFNAVSAKSDSHLQPLTLLQDADYSAMDQYINEIKDIQYTYDLGTPRRIDGYRKQRDTVVAGWQKITAELARSKAEIADLKKQQAEESQKEVLKSKFENHKQKRLIREQQATISEKDKALEQAALELAKENASLVQLQHTFSETTHQLAELKAVFNILKEENTDLKKNQTQSGLNHERIMSLLALFENSQATGWESSFIQAVKEELK